MSLSWDEIKELSLQISDSPPFWLMDWRIKSIRGRTFSADGDEVSEGQLSACLASLPGFDPGPVREAFERIRAGRFVCYRRPKNG